MEFFFDLSSTRPLFRIIQHPVACDFISENSNVLRSGLFFHRFSLKEGTKPSIQISHLVLILFWSVLGPNLCSSQSHSVCALAIGWSLLILACCKPQSLGLLIFFLVPLVLEFIQETSVYFGSIHHQQGTFILINFWSWEKY